MLIRPAQSLLLITALVVMGLSLAIFTYAGQENRKLTLYSPHVVPIMAITSISPFLAMNTPFMMKSRRTSVLCVLEWTHCLAAMFHHVFEHPFLVTTAGLVFPSYAIMMQFIKEIDYESIHTKGRKSNFPHIKPSDVTSKIDRLALISVVLYFVLWNRYGHVYVLSGAGPMTVLAPFMRYNMYPSDYTNFGVLGVLFFAENLCIIKAAIIPSQVLHFFSHFFISYAFYKINANHFMETSKRQTNNIPKILSSYKIIS